MTTVKVKFRPSTVEGRPGTIVYFVTHRRIVRQITTGYKVFPHEWDDKQSSLVVTSAGERTAVIQAVAQRIRRDMNRLDKIINGLNSGKRAFATDEIVRLFHETGSVLFRVYGGGHSSTGTIGKGTDCGKLHDSP